MQKPSSAGRWYCTCCKLGSQKAEAEMTFGGINTCGREQKEPERKSDGDADPIKDQPTPQEIWDQNSLLELSSFEQASHWM